MTLASTTRAQKLSSEKTFAFLYSLLTTGEEREENRMPEGILDQRGRKVATLVEVVVWESVIHETPS